MPEPALSGTSIDMHAFMAMSIQKSGITVEDLAELIPDFTICFSE